MLHTAIPDRARARREYKRASAAIADVTPRGLFEGYASLFGVRDLGGDIVAPGAFRETLDRRGAVGVKMLWQHESAEPIGTWLSIVEDGRGLRVRGQLNLVVARAREALALLRDGVVDGLSIGFRAERSTKQSGGGRLLQKIDLWEISLVTFPMLPQARVGSVKRAPMIDGGRVGGVIPGSLGARRTDLHIKYLRARANVAALRFEMELKRAELERRYASDQPGAPAGTSEGGRWTSGG